MNASHLEHRDDWSRRAQRFSPLAGRDRPPMAMPCRFRSQREAYHAGLRTGWIGAGAFYVLATVVMILAFHALGLHP